MPGPGPARWSATTPATARDDRPLAEQLAATIKAAEAFATGANFPRASTLAAEERAVWTLFYKAKADSAAQSAALDAVAGTDLSAIAREAVTQIQAEQALD